MNPLNRKIKIVILAFTAAGHLNTILKLTKQILLDSSALSNNVEIIIYGQEEYKLLIEKSGARYKCYKNLHLDSFKPPPLNNRKRLGYVYSIDQLFKITSDILQTLVYEIELEDPDLIMYDHFSLFGMWVVRMMRQKYQKFPKPPPLCIMYHTSFAFYDPIYPNYFEKNIMNEQDWLNRIKIIYYKIKICIVQFLFCKKFGLKSQYLNPLTDFMSHKEDLNLVFNLPELHPRSHMYDQQVYKFVGPCIENIDIELHATASITNSSIKNNKYEPAIQQIIKEFQPLISKKKILYENSRSYLIYVSLGTVFNDNFSIFKTIIEGINLYLSSNLGKNIKIIISSGGCEIHEDLKEFISKYKENNFIICKMVPQLEILKRSSLFITHCGMNSINESVYYGVPMICVPLSYDQPLIAYRVADELGLGVRINFIGLKPLQIKIAIERLIFNKNYQERCALYSEMSQNCLGQKNASKIILNYLNIFKNEHDSEKSFFE